MLSYLNPESIQAKKQTNTPIKGLYGTGYGSKVPTRWMLRVGNVWRRVYMICYSNVGSAYVMVGKREQYLGTYEP